jgi:hypothetical protein
VARHQTGGRIPVGTYFERYLVIEKCRQRYNNILQAPTFVINIVRAIVFSETILAAGNDYDA